MTKQKHAPTLKHAIKPDVAPRNANKSDTPPDLTHTPMTHHHTDPPSHPTAPTTPHTNPELQGPQHHPPDLPSYTNNKREQGTKRDGKNIDKFLEIRFLTILNSSLKRVRNRQNAKIKTPHLQNIQKTIYMKRVYIIIMVTNLTDVFPDAHQIPKSIY